VEVECLRREVGAELEEERAEVVIDGVDVAWVLAIVATPKVFGSCYGSGLSGSRAADCEAGVVRAVDRAGGVDAEACRLVGIIRAREGAGDTAAQSPAAAAGGCTIRL